MNKKSIIYLFIVLVVAAVAGLVIILFKGGVNQPLTGGPGGSAGGGEKVSLILSSDKESYQVGENVSVDIYLNTQEKKTVAADVILTYDPAILNLKYIGSEFIDKTGSVFDQFFSIADQKKGKISLSALLDPEKNFKGRGKIVSLEFEVKGKDQTEIKIVFEPGISTDSNVSYEGKDLLEEVANLNLSTL